MPLTSRVGSGNVLRTSGLAGIAIVRSSLQSTAMCFAIVFAETASPSRNRLSWRPYPKYGTTAVRRRAPASRIASAKRKSSTIIGSGCVVWTRTTCSPETGPRRRTYRSPSGNPPACFSNATSARPTESSWAIPRAREPDAEPPTIFMEGRARCMGCGYMNRPTSRAYDNDSRAFIYAPRSWIWLTRSRAVGFKESIAAAARHRRVVILAALVTTFAGVALLIDRPHGTVLEWLAAPFLSLGAALFTWAVWPGSTPPHGQPKYLANRLIRRVAFDGRIVPVFPAIGVGVILGDLAYNLVFSATPALQAEDIMVLLGARVLVGYRLVPERFERERDFVFMFCVLLNAILVAPLLLARVYYADLEKSVNVYSWVALAPQTSTVLSWLGVN